MRTEIQLTGGIFAVGKIRAALLAAAPIPEDSGTWHIIYSRKSDAEKALWEANKRLKNNPDISPKDVEYSAKMALRWDNGSAIII